MGGGVRAIPIARGLAVKYPPVVLLFVAYQCLDIYETNILVDLYEFAIGFLVTCVVVLITFLY